jgi:GT2 family glycosyltransferase
LKTTAIVILNYNGKKHLQTFLPSVVEHSADYRIIVADNGSTDDSVEFVRESFKSVELLLNTENLGFAGGYNWALPQVNANYYILLNSDVEVTQSWVSPLVELLESSDSIAACQPKIRSFTNRENFEHAGAAGGFIDKFGYPFCQGRIFDTEKDTGQYDVDREIFWASGACLAIKAEEFHAADGFDGDFYAHMEEIDLCWRLKLKGKKVFYSHNSTIYHLGGGTLNKTNPRKTYLNYRNNLLMLLKNLPTAKILPTILARMCLDGISGIRHLLQGDFGDFWAIFSAHFAFYARIPTTLKKRNQPSKVSLIYTKSIVVEYFLKKHRAFGKLKQENFRF